MFEMWSDPVYLGIVTTTMLCILLLASSYFVLQKLDPKYISSFSSVISWVFIAPTIFLGLGGAQPYPLVFITFVAIFAAKVFFQMTGMFHKSSFVLTSYIAIYACGFAIHYEAIGLFQLMPAILFLAICLIPMITNSYKNMIQYMSLSLVAFFLIWMFLHVGLIMQAKKGIYIVIYLIILTEVFENSYLRASRHLKNIKLIDKINSKRSLEGYVIGATITLSIAWVLREIVPFGKHWWVIGTCCVVFGSTGNTVLTVIRRDLGLKVYESFVIGRGDFFTRIERLVFVAPATYYAMDFLKAL